MKIIDEDLLDVFRQAGRCELCSRPGADPHHVLSRGMGSATRLDVRENLLCLCRACHDRAHYSACPRRRVLLLVIADREGRPVDEIEAKLYALWRARK